ncbi:hypothetical protein B296_00022226 [Ensete ventricosum]|uniref:Uncharacterized protein n=1 Tax=Ensete ventricosum TaxID=4639 RepID=A0A426YA38_ENSVE|nr:hypothetical protein B296_00022226 [Ensete ventricosum]
MGMLKQIKPLNSISLEMDDSNLHPCGIDDSEEPKIALPARDPPDRVSFSSREVNLHAGAGSSFSQKDCPNPSCPLYATAATAALARATGLLVVGGCHCGSVAALDDTSRAGGRRPFVGWLRALPMRPSRRQASPLAGWPRAAALASGPGYLWLPLQRAWSWLATLAEGLAMASHPLSPLCSLRKYSKDA